MLNPTLGITLGDLQPASAQTPVDVNIATWTAAKYPHTSARARFAKPTISRDDLTVAAKQLWLSDLAPTDADIEALFVLVMMWASGTTNGRGPRNTEAALASGAVASIMTEARQLLAEQRVADAYPLCRRLPGVGPAFFTKLLWVIGKTVDVRPTPLTLDAVVWSELAHLCWHSERAAGSKNWGKRYEAYLRACEIWATDGFTPDDVEYTLFSRGRES